MTVKIRYKVSHGIAQQPLEGVLKTRRCNGKDQQTADGKTEEAEKKSKTNRQGKTQIGRTEVRTGEELLLHICCAPCATYVIGVLSETYSVTAFFYNPNIQPDEEYHHRLREVRRYTAIHDIPLLVEEDNSHEWDELVRGFEQEPEGGKRCELCFSLRLRRTAEAAAHHGIGRFTTTLTISPHKDTTLINSIGAQAAVDAGVCFVPEDFKRNNGFRKSCDLSRQYGLYRQRYCGCIHSLRSQAHGKNSRADGV